MYVNLGAVEPTWYEKLLQTGVSLYDKYKVITDVKKQQKTAVEYRAFLDEQSRLAEQARAMAIQQAKVAETRPTPSYTMTYVLVGGAVLATFMYMKKR